MNLTIKKILSLHGQVLLPSSKSQSIRAIILALLGHGESTLTNILHAEDVQDAVNVCKNLGAKITESGNTLVIKSFGLPLKPMVSKIYSGNSGITTRFIMPILGLRENSDQPIILNCGRQMRKRPIKSLVSALMNLGLTIEYLANKDELPVKISGKLVGGATDVDGITSQYLSALLIALPCAEKDSVITVKNLHERPYVTMTLHWLSAQGIKFTHEMLDDTDIFYIKGNQNYKNFITTIASDFSSASYFIAAASLISGKVILQGLDMADPQGDKRLVNILQKMGADIHITSQQLHIRGGKELCGIKIDANDIPDLLPTLAVIGTYASGKTEIYNVAQARMKETDRIHSMTDGLTRMGAKIEEKADGLTIYQSTLKGASIKGYGDHRTVMAFCIAGLLAQGQTIIDECEAINKTFPTFINAMRSLGADFEVENASIP